MEEISRENINNNNSTLLYGVNNISENIFIPLQGNVDYNNEVISSTLLIKEEEKYNNNNVEKPVTFVVEENTIINPIVEYIEQFEDWQELEDASGYIYYYNQVNNN